MCLSTPSLHWLRVESEHVEAAGDAVLLFPAPEPPPPSERPTEDSEAARARAAHLEDRLERLKPQRIDLILRRSAEESSLRQAASMAEQQKQQQEQQQQQLSSRNFNPFSPPTPPKPLRQRNGPSLRQPELIVGLRRDMLPPCYGKASLCKPPAKPLRTNCV